MIDSFTKLVRLIMPSGTKIQSRNGIPCRATWAKHGGHMGTTQLRKLVQKAREQCFTEADCVMTGTPDGSHMGSGRSFISGCGTYTLRISASYGVTKENNNYHAVLEIVQDHQ
jgi:hypothetical protein